MELAWLAGTAAGGDLGRLAVQTVGVRYQPLPFWFFPLEPLRWWVWLSTAGPHVFYTGLLYLAIAVGVGCRVSRRWHAPRRGVVAALNTLLVLCGLYLGMIYLLTCVPHGISWEVPPNAPYRLADLHAHSQASGGFFLPEDVVAWHMRKGYQIVAVTDSNTIRGGLRARQKAQERRWPVLVAVGEEYRGTTHLLMYGIQQDIRADRVALPQAVAEAHRQGGLVLAAHAWTGIYTTAQLRGFGVAGFEVTNGGFVGDTDMLDLCRAQSLAEVGDLDFRYGNSAVAATVLPAWVETEAQMLAALRSGQCAALYFPSLVQSGHFSPWKRIQLSFSWMVRDGRWVMLPGFALWILVGGWGWRRWRWQPQREGEVSWGQLWVVMGLAVATAVMSGTTLWWKFRLGWYPRTEWLPLYFLASIGVSWAVSRQKQPPT